jgi:6-pyruvoyltetrahydropterin/6-carboxytetrahydropterin synthase
MMNLIIKTKFDAAHCIKGYKGKCSHVHGHTWFIDIYVKVKDINDIGISIDFKELKEKIKECLPDHTYLNEIYSFNPTCENLAKKLFSDIKNKNINIVKLTLWETLENGIEYIED